MCKKLQIVAATLAAVAAPTPALANIYVPSFVRMLTAPGPMSFLIYTVFWTVPVLLSIGFLEALVLRRYTKAATLPQLTFRLAAINGVSSAIGWVVLPTGTEIWALPLAFVLTIPVEAAILELAEGKRLGLGSLRRVIIISTRMNALSYSVLAVVVAGLVYVPAIGHEDNSIAREVSGRLLVVQGQASNLLDLSDGSLRRTQGSPPGWNRGVSISGDAIVVCREDGVRRYVLADLEWSSTKIDLSQDGADVYALSHDGSRACCVQDRTGVVRDLETGKILCQLPKEHSIPDYCLFSPDGEFLACRYSRRMKDGGVLNRQTFIVDVHSGEHTIVEDAYCFAFSPVEPVLAWAHDQCITLHDCRTRKRTTIRLPGPVRSDIAWSPDGRFIAFLGHMSEFTMDGWSPDIRVVRVSDGRSTTLHKRLFTSGAPCRLLWLRPSLFRLSPYLRLPGRHT